MQPSSFASLLFAASAVAMITASCGGSIAPIGEDDDAGSASDGSSSGDGASDAGRDGDPAPVDGGGGKDSGNGGRSCDRLRQDIDSLRIAATKCCPTCKSLQCQEQAKDLCCPVTVTSASSGESQKLQAAVAAYAQQGCDVACPAIPCKSGGSGVCDPVTSRCQQ